LLSASGKVRRPTECLGALQAEVDRAHHVTHFAGTGRRRISGLGAGPNPAEIANECLDASLAQPAPDDTVLRCHRPFRAPSALE